MASVGFKTALNSFSRVFLIDGRANPKNAPTFQSCLKAGGIDQSFGDVEKIECPSPSEYGKFVEIGKIRGAVERATTTFTGRYALDVASELLRLARKGCTIDVQIHFGTCTDPREFDTFSKAVVLEDAVLTDYSTEDLGALASDEQGKIDESASVSARDVYEIVPLSFAERANNLITDPVTDITVADTAACGECDEISDGCQKIYAVTSGPALPAAAAPIEVLFSLDGGALWYEAPVGPSSNYENGHSIAALGQWLLVAGDDGATPGHYYAFKGELDGSGDPVTWTQVTDGYVAGAFVNDLVSVGNYAFGAADNGYIYGYDDATSGVDVLDAGVVHNTNYNAVAALSEKFAVAVGDGAAIARTDSQDIWTEISVSVEMSTKDFTSVFLLDERTWLVGTTGGEMFCTVDGGTIWEKKVFPGSGAGFVHDITGATGSVLYMSHTNASGVARLLRSYNGGYSWVVLPESVGSLPTADSFDAISACAGIPNKVYFAGAQAANADGIIVVGQA